MPLEPHPMNCVNCGRSVDEVPLLVVAQRDGTSYICPQCLPVLIHQPQQLVDKLPGAGALQPHEH